MTAQLTKATMQHGKAVEASGDSSEADSELGVACLYPRVEFIHAWC